MQPKDKYERIENYGIIGNLHTVALVSMNGSIDFMCYHRFDSPTIFGSLLDSERGGTFSISPTMENVTYKQLYLPDTAVLVSRFFSDKGMAEIIDFMPVLDDEKNFSLIRKITSIKGDISYEMNLSPRFDYGRAEHRFQQTDSGYLIESNDFQHSALQLTSNIKMESSNGNVHSKFTLKESESAYFILESNESYHQRASKPDKFVEDSYQDTIRFWQSWIEASTYSGRWIEMVNRSAITLKLLTSYSNSSMVAAATFGLPEAIPGERNWDYRYTWIRDAALSVYALLRIGYPNEAASFLAWVLAAVENGETPGVLYDLDGNIPLTEQIDPELEGYRKSRPVRWGNAAASQLQNDVLGEILDCAFQWSRCHGNIEAGLWSSLAKLVEAAEKGWREPDHGIWEVRKSRRPFTYSAVMCHTAVVRGAAIAEQFGLPANIPRWRASAEDIRRTILEEAWDKERETLTAYLGGRALDASLLSLPLRRFIAFDDPRMVGTARAIARELDAGDGLLFRYNPEEIDDGLPGREGAFLLCSFWMVDNLAGQGRIDEALRMYESLCRRAGPLGLLPEQIDPESGLFLGNYPQAFSHIGLISSGILLSRLMK